MIKTIKIFNHEIWVLCCGEWYDRRNEYCCPRCGNK